MIKHSGIFATCVLLSIATAQTIAAPTPVGTVSPANKAASTTKVLSKKAEPTPAERLLVLQRELQHQAVRLGQLEEANRAALTRNQALQLENDNLKVQIKVLQSERSAQMFLYGAVTISVGALIGYLFANYLHRRTRRW